MRGPAALPLLLALATVLPAQAQSRPPKRQAAAPPPATDAFGPACRCENIKALQQELANALTLRDRHAAKAAELSQRYGDRPAGEKLAEARKDYRAFETGSGPGSAAQGLKQVAAGQAQAINYVPRGQALQEAHARDERKGIPLAETWTADGRPEPDLEARRRIEEEYRKKGEDLCDHQDRAAVEKSAAAGAACGGAARALVAHEDSHQATCRRMGYYAFVNRSPAELARDEVAAYEGHVGALAAEIRRLLTQKKAKVTKGTPGADPRSLVDLDVRCAVAFAVKGQIDDLKLFGDVCDAAEPYTIKTSPNANMKLTPGADEKSGSYAYRGVVAGAATFYGSGGYMLDMQAGRLVLDGSGRWWATNPVGTASKGGPETLRVKELPEGCS